VKDKRQICLNKLYDKNWSFRKLIFENYIKLAVSIYRDVSLHIHVLINGYARSVIFTSLYISNTYIWTLSALTHSNCVIRRKYISKCFYFSSLHTKWQIWFSFHQTVIKLRYSTFLSDYVKGMQRWTLIRVIYKQTSYVTEWRGIVPFSQLQGLTLICKDKRQICLNILNGKNGTLKMLNILKKFKLSVSIDGEVSLYIHVLIDGYSSYVIFTRLYLFIYIYLYIVCTNWLYCFIRGRYNSKCCYFTSLHTKWQIWISFYQTDIKLRYSAFLSDYVKGLHRWTLIRV
jgi:hypothetical protein